VVVGGRGVDSKVESSVSSEPSRCSVLRKRYSSALLPGVTDYLLKNSYIDTSVQKGRILKVPGCLEHTRVVTQLIREAQENKGDLVVLWLDLANTYGSIPHKLVEEALNRHHSSTQASSGTSSWTILTASA